MNFDKFNNYICAIIVKSDIHNCEKRYSLILCVIILKKYKQ